MKFSMTGQEKCNLLIQVTAWTDLIVNETAEESLLSSTLTMSNYFK